MKVLYEGFIFSIQRAGGVNRYFSNLIDRLPQDFSPSLTAFGRQENNFPSNKKLRCRILPKRILGSEKAGRAWAQCHWNLTQTLGSWDLIHPTYYSLLSGKAVAKRKVPLVVTVYDMISERFPRLDSSGGETSRKRDAVAAADAIICISEHTKRDLVEFMGVPPERIRVIYLATEMGEEMGRHEKVSLAEPYVLFVGSRTFYKNFARLLVAFSSIRNSWPELRLGVVGPPFSPAEEEWLRALNLWERVTLIPDVDDGRLAALYRSSQALIYPSLYEGFGIPLLEAMACGTVVIAAETSSIPEVVGDAAILFNPTSTEQLAECILALKNLGARRFDYIDRGKKRVAAFSWDKMAVRTVDLYRSLAK